MTAKPVWTNTNRINHANQFVPRPVQLKNCRPNINSVRTNINTGKININSVRSRVNTVTTNVNTVRSRQPVPTKTSNSFSPKRPQGSVVKDLAVIMGGTRNQTPIVAVEQLFIRTVMLKDHPLKNMVDRGIFDSGCSGHMTGNKDQLEDFEEFNGGSVTFGGSKGYISGKGKIRVGNLDFDSVSFVKELGHFNLFSISQICDKQHKVLFTETECLVVSSDFKMPDENQILLKVPRHHNMYSFDMKTPTPAKEKPNVKGVGYRWMFDIDYLTDSMNYIPVSLENQANPHAAVKNTEEKVESRTSSTNSKKEEILTEPQQEKKASSTDTSEDNPKILAFRRELEEIALKHLGTVSENNTTSTPSVNTGSESVNTGRFDPDDSPMPELEIFHKSETGIFDEASYDEEGVITDFNSLPTEIEVSPTPTLRIHNIHPKSQILGDPKSAVQTRSKDHPLKNMVDRGIFDSGCSGHMTGNKDQLEDFEEFNGGSVTPKTSHLNAVKRIFKYLKGKPNLGLWYPRESPFDLEAFSNSDYGGSNLDRKSTTGGCQFLGQRLISWQCKKQTIVATSTTEAEYVAAANCCGQVLWVQNQLLDYGFNFMNTKIHIDNESTICIVKNPVYHSKTKHIEIRHHFIRDCYEKKLISVEKIHTDLNVADLLTKPFDGPRFNYLVVSIATPIYPLSQPAPPTPITETTNASPSPTPSPTHEQIEHTFEHPSTDQQSPTPSKEATTSQLMAQIDDLEKQLKDTKQTFGKAILTLVERGRKFHDLDPLVSLLQELVTPSKTVNASGEEQVEAKHKDLHTGALSISSVQDERIVRSTAIAF
ncbi:hypothetical protein Tco_1361926 [Tanacetum coccineum]